MNSMVDTTARDDFNRARKQALFSRLFSLFSPGRRELLSLTEVRQVIKPRGEHYRGLQQVPVDRIVGSEGRYQDFTKQFLPRREHLRHRWQSVDRAHLTDVILPPIQLYEIGGVYFVRDGNHRVSVARAQGAVDIDAEVTALDSEIPLTSDMTSDDLRRAVIEHERRRFEREFDIGRILPGVTLTVSATGRYDDLRQHIFGHKYYLNERETIEIPLQQAIRSWYANVYKPIVDEITRTGVLARFPGRTPTDLYLWVVRHWDELKHRYGQDFPAAAAARDYSARFGKGTWRRLVDWFRSRIIGR